MEVGAQLPGRSRRAAAGRRTPGSTAARSSSGAGKLGLGSSAAVAAAAVGALLDAAGCDIEYTQGARLHARQPRPSRGPGRARLGRGRRGGDPRRRPLLRAAATATVDRAAAGSARARIELMVFSTGTPSSTVDHVRALEPYAATRSPDRVGRACAEHRRRRRALHRRLRRRRRAAPSSPRRRGEHRARGARRRRSDCRSSPRASPRRRSSPRSWAARPSRRARAAVTSASRF